ncbi:MAG: hypothetical protein IPN95_06695 [Bacteroidetes bacterium]|nr:hypothetical protein [Bacteroidota bacterium]
MQGECNIYDKAGLLIYTGTLKDFLPEGAGKSYAQNDQKVVISWNLCNGRLLEEISTPMVKFLPEVPWADQWLAVCLLSRQAMLSSGIGLAGEGVVAVEGGGGLSGLHVKGVRDGLSGWVENNLCTG